jgi:hypothetical protein
MLRIDVVIIVGWQHGILTRPYRMMNRIVPAEAAEASESALAIAAVPVVRMDAVEWPLYAAHEGQE